MNYYNGWKSRKRNWDKLDITLRISKLTIFSIKVDLSNKYYNINILNIGIKKK
jgi:hypothetical protein